MPFFIPESLLRFNHFRTEEISKQAEPYLHEIDFAFFAVNFGYSKSEFEELTPTDRAFIMKAYENKIVSDSTLMRNAVFNAISNVFRKKGKSFIPLWKDISEKITETEIKADVDIINEVEQKEGKTWVAQIMRRRNFESRN